MSKENGIQGRKVINFKQLETPADEGWHDAVVSGVDLKHNLTDNSGMYNEAVIVYQFDDVELPQPYRFGIDGINKNSTLYEHSSRIMRTDELPLQFDLNMLINRECRIQVIHHVDDSGGYEEVNSIEKYIPKKTPRAYIVNEHIIDSR